MGLGNRQQLKAATEKAGTIKQVCDQAKYANKQVLVKVGDCVTRANCIPNYCILDTDRWWSMQIACSADSQVHLTDR